VTVPELIRWWRLRDLAAGLFAVLVAAVALIGSGAPSAAAQTRVGGQPQNLIFIVGVQNAAAHAGARVDAVSELRLVSATGVAAESGGIAANAAAGNAARDAIAAQYPGSLTEQTFSTALGARRVDVLTQDGLAIESKVGRTSLTSGIQSQIAKDQLLLQNGDVNGVQWVFGRSRVTGQIGPTGPL